MSTVTLGEIVEIKGGGTPDKSVESYWGGDIPWASVKDFKSTEITQTIDRITPMGVANSATNIIPAGTLLVPTRMAVGKAAINSVAMAINQDLKALKPKPGVETRYLLHALIANASSLEAQATGATVKGITLDVLRALPIRLPSLDEQKRIAAIFDQADDLRRKRQRALGSLDQLSQAIFHEMFGNPVLNDRHFPVELLSAVSRNITDGTHDTPERTSSGIPFVTSKNVRPFELDLADLDFVSPETHRAIIKRCNPKKGDILYTNIGASVGSAAQNRFDFEFSLKNVALIQLDLKRLAPDYLEFTLNNAGFKRAMLSASAAGGAQKFVTLKALRNAPIPVPPLAQQLSFAKKVSEFSAQKNRMSVHETSFRDLFQSLQHRVFRGEL